MQPSAIVENLHVVTQTHAGPIDAIVTEMGVVPNPIVENAPPDDFSDYRRRCAQCADM